MALHPIACAPDDDDVLVISGAKLSSTKRKWSLTLDHILVAVHFIAPEVLRVEDATPFRSAATAHIAVAVDAFGALHAVDVVAGTLLFSLPAVGAPVDVAARDRDLAIATREKIVLWRAGKQSEIHVSATAIAFGDAGLAFATEQGVFVDDAAVPFAERPGKVVDLAQQRDGAWLIGGAEGLFAAKGRLLDGAARRVAVDQKCIVLQRSDTMIAVYNLPLVTPAKRIHYADRVIAGLALTAGDLVVALDGGKIERINLRTGKSDGVGVVEDAEAKSYLSGRIGNRRGVIAIIPVASAAALCLWTYLHHAPAPPTAPRFMPIPKLVLPECDAGCELDRLDRVILACNYAPEAPCVDAAMHVKEAFGARQCTSVRLQLDELAEKVKARPVVDAVKRAQAGLATACFEPAVPKVQLLAFRAGASVRSVPPPANLGEVIAFAADSTSHLYIAASHEEQCEVYRREVNVDTQWATILTVSGCVKGDLAVKRADDVYFAGSTGVMHYDGTTWSPAETIDADVMDAFAHPEATKWPRPDGDTTAASGLSPSDIYAGGTSGLFHFDGKQWIRMLDAPVDRLASNPNETWVMIETK